MRRRIVRFSAAAVCLLSIPTFATIATGQPAAAVGGSPSSFTALKEPVRLADTRTTGAFGGGLSYELAVTGGELLPAKGSISAAVLNVTVVGPAATGFWTVYPHGNPLPTASNVNVDPVSAFRGIL